MLKTLLRTYWRSMIHSLFFRDSRKAPGRLKKAGILLLLLYVAGIFLFLSGSMFFSMARPLNRLGLDWLYFLLALAAAFFLMLTGSVFLAITQLYEARDNELLLSLPIPASLILFSRLLLLYLTDLLYGIVAVGPALAAYALRIQVSPSWLIPSLLLYLLLPLPVISVSCLLGAAFAAVGKRIRHKTAAVLLLWLLFLGGYLFLCRRLFAGLPDLLLHAPRIAGWLARMLNPLYQIGSAAAGNLRALGYTALAFGLTFAAAYGILTVTFVKMITSNRGFRKIKDREKRGRRYPVLLALMGKEWKHFSSSPGYMLNAGCGIVFAAAAGIFLLIRQDAVARLAGLSLGGVSLEEEMAGFLLTGLCFLASFNFISAPSISLEGKSLWILKSSPVTARQILAGKLLFHVTVCLPALLLAQGAVLWVLRPSFAMAALLLVLPVLVLTLTGMLGLFWNLLFPRLDFLSETRMIKNSLSSTLTVLLSLLLSLLPMLARQGLGLFADWKPEGYYALWTAAAAAGCGALWRWLKKSGARRLEAL